MTVSLTTWVITLVALIAIIVFDLIIVGCHDHLFKQTA